MLTTHLAFVVRCVGKHSEDVSQKILHGHCGPVASRQQDIGRPCLGKVLCVQHSSCQRLGSGTNRLACAGCAVCAVVQVCKLRMVTSSQCAGLEQEALRQYKAALPRLAKNRKKTDCPSTALAQPDTAQQAMPWPGAAMVHNCRGDGPRSAFAVQPARLLGSWREPETHLQTRPEPHQPQSLGRRAGQL